ncbi:hypothetical protein [Halostella litorea]|uniref:hypothetical protein n=1 Tax=Halostella litorea TaxID=2528831 RepID=UPI001091AA22|nr:hypothetical protein [Halostella litorea]
MFRRKFIKTSGIATTIGLSGVASAASATRPGIPDRVKELLRDGELERAHDALDDRSVGYSHTRTIMGSGDGGGSDGVSTEDFLQDPEDGSGTLDLGVYDTQTDGEFYAFLYWDLDYSNTLVDGPGPDDGVSISFSDNAFRLIPDSPNHSDQTNSHDTNQYGYWAEFNDVKPYLINGGVDGPDGSSSDDVSTQNHGDSDTNHNEGWLDLRVEVRDDYDSTHANVYSDYVHSWNPGGVPTNLGISFSLGGVGALTYDVTGRVDTWRAEDNVAHEVQ